MDVQAIAPEGSSDLDPGLEPQTPPQSQVLNVPVATAAPLAKPESSDSPEADSRSGVGEVLGLPLQFLNQLLQKLGATPLQSLADLVPALQILTLAVLAGLALRLAGATLDAINEIPLVGGLLELVGLVALLNAVARNAFKQQKRAELLERIRTLRRNLLG